MVHRVGTRFSWLVFLALWGLAPVPQAWAEDVVVREFGIGSGPGAMGRPQSGEGTDGDGPQAIYAGRNGEIYLLDQVNGRVVTFDGKDSAGPTRSLTLPDGIEATDMIATETGLIVWDGKPIALDERGDGLTRSLAVSRDVSAAGDETVLSMFGSTGSVDAGSVEEARAAASRSVGGGAIAIPNGPVRKSVGTHGAGPVSVLFTPDARRTALDIAIASKSSQAKLAQLRINSRDQMGAVELLEIDKLGRLYVLVEIVPDRKQKVAHTLVVRFAQNSNFEGVFELPVKPDIGMARRFVTVSPDGDVYFLRTRKGAVDVIGVGFIPVTARLAQEVKQGAKKGAKKGTTKGSAQAALKTGPVPANLPISGIPSTTASDGSPLVDSTKLAIAAIGPLSRRRVVETAFGFEGIRWRVTPATYGQDPDSRCSGFDRIRRPGYLRGMNGGEARGVPYCWGCSGSLASFANRISRGTLAGNVCTRDDPRRDVAGVDCSSFVSATWGLATHFTTSMIPSIATAISDPWSMKPGDVFNKPNSHVMLFLGYTADRKVQVIEASPGACNGRVCRNIYPMASLLGRGYTPRRYRGLENDASDPLAKVQSAAAPKNAGAAAAPSVPNETQPAARKKKRTRA